MATKKKLKVLHASNIDSGRADNSETFNTTLPANIDSDTALAVTNWARSFVNLTKDTYVDVEITETVSLNELIAE